MITKFIIYIFPFFLHFRTAVTGVTYVKEKPDLILMHDDNTIAVLDKEKDMPEPSAKVKF